MDGVRRYNGVVWCGATNNPNRLSPAVLRRFAYVDAVGELNLIERANLLKYYTELGLPVTKDITIDDYMQEAKVLDGAVGDIVRKVSDNIHEYVLYNFINKHRKEAKALEARLNKNGFDVSILTKAERKKVKQEIGKYVVVDKKMLHDAVVYVAELPAIQREITEAKRVYGAAKNIKNELKDNTVSRYIR